MIGLLAAAILLHGEAGDWDEYALLLLAPLAHCRGPLGDAAAATTRAQRMENRVSNLGQPPANTRPLPKHAIPGLAAAPSAPAQPLHPHGVHWSTFCSDYPEAMLEPTAGSGRWSETTRPIPIALGLALLLSLLLLPPSAADGHATRQTPPDPAPTPLPTVTASGRLPLPSAETKERGPWLVPITIPANVVCLVRQVSHNS